MNGQVLIGTSNTKANLSPTARFYLSTLGIADHDPNPESALLLWMHSLAVGYSTLYLEENADGIRCDWPRIPLPRTMQVMDRSVSLGRRIASLLDSRTEVVGITTGKNMEPVFKTIGVVARVGGGALSPDDGDLALTAGWGHAGKEGVTMPAKGRIVQRPYSEEEREAVAIAAKARGLPVEDIFSFIGLETLDVYLNEKAFWKNIPVGVWEYHIGGYQVIKKWLSYREKELLGRDLMVEEAREVSSISHRIAAIVLMQPELNENYRRVKLETVDFESFHQ